MDRQCFGRNLRRLRLVAGFGKQTQLAMALRTAGGTTLPDPVQLGRQISTWECGKHIPSAFYRELLCEVLGCEMRDLLADPDGGPPRGASPLSSEQVARLLGELDEFVAEVSRRRDRIASMTHRMANEAGAA